MDKLIFETERLIVRESKVEDVDTFYTLYEDELSQKFMDPLDLDEEVEYEKIDSYIKFQYGFYGFGIWTVILKETGEIVGRGGVEYKELKGEPMMEIGYLIHKDYRQKGLAYELSKRIVRYVKEELEEEALYALIQKGNEISIRLIEKLGFVMEKKVRLDKKLYFKYKLDLRGDFYEE